MKKIVWVMLSFVFIIALNSCMEQKETRMAKEDLKTEDQKSSYTFGIDLAKKLTKSPEFKYESFLQGLKDQVEGKELLLTQEEMMKLRNASEKLVDQKQENQKQEKENWIKPDNNAILSDKFLYDNKDKEGVVTTESGLQYKVITQGKGAKPQSGDKVKVHYIGTLRRGEEFDNSYTRGAPAEFKLEQVIEGWQEGLKLMSIGSKCMFYIPPKLGYGSKGKGKISPNSVLIFEVELLDIIK